MDGVSVEYAEEQGMTWLVPTDILIANELEAKMVRHEIQVPMVGTEYRFVMNLLDEIGEGDVQEHQVTLLSAEVEQLYLRWANILANLEEGKPLTGNKVLDAQVQLHAQTRLSYLAQHLDREKAAAILEETREIAETIPF